MNILFLMLISQIVGGQFTTKLLTESDKYKIEKAATCNVTVNNYSDKGPIVKYNATVSLWLNFTVNAMTSVEWCSVKRNDECIDKTDELEHHHGYIISNYTISSFNYSDWGVYYVRICDKRIEDFIIYFDPNNCTNYNIPNVTDIAPKKYVGLKRENTTIDIFYEGDATSFSYDPVCNCSGAIIYATSHKTYPHYSLKILKHNTCATTLGELQLINPSSQMSNCTCYVNGSTKGRNGTSEIVILDYPFAESVAVREKTCTSNYFEYSWAIRAVCDYLKPLVYIDNKDISTYQLKYEIKNESDPNIKYRTILGLKIYNAKKLDHGRHEIKVLLMLDELVHGVSTYNDHPNTTETLIVNIQSVLSTTYIIVIIIFSGCVTMIILCTFGIICAIKKYKKRQRQDNGESQPLLHAALDEQSHNGGYMSNLQQQQQLSIEAHAPEDSSSSSAEEQDDTAGSLSQSPGEQVTSPQPVDVQIEAVTSQQPVGVDEQRQVEQIEVVTSQQPVALREQRQVEVVMSQPENVVSLPSSEITQQEVTCNGGCAQLITPHQESIVNDTESQQYETRNQQVLVTAEHNYPASHLLSPVSPNSDSSANCQAVCDKSKHNASTAQMASISQQGASISSNVFILYHLGGDTDAQFKENIKFMVTLLSDVCHVHCDIFLNESISFSDWAKEKLQNADRVILIGTPEICERLNSSAPIVMSEGEIESEVIFRCCQEKSLVVTLHGSTAVPLHCPLPSTHCYELDINTLKQVVHTHRKKGATSSRHEIVLQYIQEHHGDISKDYTLLLDKLKK